MAMPGPARQELGPVGEDDEERDAPDPIDDEIQFFQAGGIGPVSVLEQHHGGLAARHRLYQVDERSDRSLLLPLRGHGQWSVPFLARDRQHGGDQADVFDRTLVLSHHELLELVELGGYGLIAAEPERPLESVDGGVERTVDVIRRTLQSPRALDLVLQALAQRIQDARLADARLPPTATPPGLRLPVPNANAP